MEHIEPDRAGKPEIKGAGQNCYCYNDEKHRQRGHVEEIPRYHHTGDHFGSCQGITDEHGPEEKSDFPFEFIVAVWTALVHPGHPEFEDVALGAEDVARSTVRAFGFQDIGDLIHIGKLYCDLLGRGLSGFCTFRTYSKMASEECLQRYCVKDRKELWIYP